MRIIEQSHRIIKIDENPLELIEQAARTCWRSEDKIKPGSDAQIAKTLKAKGHGSMLEIEQCEINPMLKHHHPQFRRMVVIERCKCNV